MKHLNKLFVAALVFVGLSLQAQDSNNPWAVAFGVNGIDGARVSAASKIEDQFSEYFNVEDNWSIIPSVSYLNVSRHISNGFSVGLTGSVNRVTKFVLPRNGAPDYTVVNPGDLTYYGADLDIKYSFGRLFKFLEPSAHIGGGYTWLGDNSFGTANGGLGLNIWFNEYLGLQLRSTYKHSFDDNRLEAPTHIQHFAGIVFQFGGSDRDGDGIYDKDDECPDEPGLKQFNGCADNDGDGIPNHKDECPDLAGTAEFNGCPDTDGDGIPNHKDSCPEVKGLKQFNGCPDTDGDGIEDSKDKCPTVKGSKENNGCPWPDRDGDSVLDKDDKCPDVKGTVKNQGCPEMNEEAVKKLKDFAKAIYFDTGKSTLRAESNATLEAIKGIMNEYSTAKFAIEGHTDSTGNAAKNLQLSKDRAAAVKTWLTSNGINASRLTSEGYGQDKPVADNKTNAGRQQNRRTEINVIQ